MTETKPGANPYAMNIDQIRKFLPHRAPFLLVELCRGVADRVSDFDLETDAASEMLLDRCSQPLLRALFEQVLVRGRQPQLEHVPGFSHERAVLGELACHSREREGGEKARPVGNLDRRRLGHARRIDRLRTLGLRRRRNRCRRGGRRPPRKASSGRISYHSG